LVEEGGKQAGIVPTEEAISRAREAGFDLVEVAPAAEPPVCRIMDYGKFKYQQQKKDHKGQKKSHAGQLKELRMRPKIDTHDLEIKLKHGMKFVEDGYRLQLTVVFRGREMRHTELGVNLLKKIVDYYEGIAKIEQSLRQDGRRMSVTLTPKPKSERDSKRMKKVEVDDAPPPAIEAPKATASPEGAAAPLPPSESA